jgi:hypothetical protein
MDGPFPRSQSSAPISVVVDRNDDPAVSQSMQLGSLVWLKGHEGKPIHSLEKSTTVMQHTIHHASRSGRWRAHERRPSRGQYPEEGRWSRLSRPLPTSSLLRSPFRLAAANQGTIGRVEFDNPADLLGAREGVELLLSTETPRRLTRRFVVSCPPNLPAEATSADGQLLIRDG